MPEWVYATLTKYHNVALPNACMLMNRQSLKKHLEKAVGFKLKIRKAIIKSADTRYLSRRVKEQEYLIAEERK